jgi:hypothetical protein
VTVEHPFAAYPDGKRAGCVRCPYPPGDHPAPPPPDHVERDPAAEHAVLDAATTGSALDHSGLWGFACQRAYPGGVKVQGRSLRREPLEELADALNYIVWEVVYVLEPRAAAGDSVAAGRIPSRLGAIRKLIEAWDMLHLP